MFYNNFHYNFSASTPSHHTHIMIYHSTMYTWT